MSYSRSSARSDLKTFTFPLAPYNFRMRAICDVSDIRTFLRLMLMAHSRATPSKATTVPDRRCVGGFQALPHRSGPSETVLSSSGLMPTVPHCHENFAIPKRRLGKINEAVLAVVAIGPVLNRFHRLAPS